MIYTKHFIMKYLISIMLLSASSLWAQQSFPFVLDTTFDVPYATYSGKGYARCLITLNDTTIHYKFTLMPPQYDSILVEASPAYDYYDLDPKTTLPSSNSGEKMHFEPPKYVIEKHRKLIDIHSCILTERLNADCLSMNPKFCLFLSICEMVNPVINYKRHRLVENAKIVYGKGRKTRFEILDSTSAFLRKVTVPPQYAYVKTHDYRKQRYRIEANFDFLKYEHIRQDTGKMRPFLTEWRDIVCCYYKVALPTVTNIQLALVKRGYLEKENGLMDKETKKALRRFEHDKGLPKSKGLPVGSLNDDTLKSLGLYSND